MIKKFKLFESPDHPTTFYKKKKIDLNNKTDVPIKYSSYDAFAFGYVPKKLLYNFSHLEVLKSDLEISKNDGDENQIRETEKKIENHIEGVNVWLKMLNFNSIEEFEKLAKVEFDGEDYYLFIGVPGNLSYHSDFGTDRSMQKFPGRIWTNTKYISFWKHPATYEELIKIVKGIDKLSKTRQGKNLNIYADREEWLVEVNGEIIPLTEYKGGESNYTEEELKAPHNMDWEEKEEWKKSGKFGEFGSKKGTKENPIEWKNALGKFRGESVQKFNDFE